MRVLVCPDKFRGTLTAHQAAEAIARGWRRARPDDHLAMVPLADGGEGTLDVLVPVSADASASSRRVTRTVTGPRGEQVDAAAGVLGRTGVVEMARASGIQLLSEARRDPCRTTTRGTGELMRALLDEGVDRLLVCLGGSATNDGGAGMARALGIRFLDVAGEAIGEGGSALLDLARGAPPRASRPWPSSRRPTWTIRCADRGVRARSMARRRVPRAMTFGSWIGRSGTSPPSRLAT